MAYNDKLIILFNKEGDKVVKLRVVMLFSPLSQIDYHTVIRNNGNENQPGLKIFKPRTKIKTTNIHEYVYTNPYQKKSLQTGTNKKSQQSAFSKLFN